MTPTDIRDVLRRKAENIKLHVQPEVFSQAAELIDGLIDRPRGTYECFHCCTKSVVWQCDYSFEDFGYEGEGIVQICQCANCGAEIEYRISLGDEEE